MADISMLLAMGFTEDDAKLAMKQSHNDLERAVSLLVDGNLHRPGSPDSQDSLKVHPEVDDDRGSPEAKRRRGGVDENVHGTEMIDMATDAYNNSVSGQCPSANTQDSEIPDLVATSVVPHQHPRPSRAVVMIGSDDDSLDEACFEVPDEFSLEQDDLDKEIISRKINQIDYVFFDQASPETVESNRQLLNSLKPPQNNDPWSFPAIALYQLEDTLFRQSKWKVPLKFSEPFGICIQASIKALLEDYDWQADEAMKKFLNLILNDCMDKLFNNQSARSWKKNILNQIHQLNQLLVRLSIVMIKKGLLQGCSVLHTLTSRTTELAHHCRYNDIPYRFKSDCFEQYCPILASDSFEHINWLMDNWNEFFNLGGADALSQALSDPNLTTSGLESIMEIFFPRANFTKLGKDALKSIMQSALDAARRFDVTALSGPEFEKLSSALGIMHKNSPDPILAEVDELGIEHVMILKANFDTFARQMNMMKAVGRLASESQITLNTLGNETKLTIPFISNFIHDEQIIELCLTKNLHHPQYVSRLEHIIEYLARAAVGKRLTVEQINKVWQAQVGQHDAIVENIQTMICSIAWALQKSHMQQLFKCVRSTWMEHKSDFRLMSTLLAFLNKFCRGDGVVTACLTLIWDLIHNEMDLHPQTYKLAIETHSKILCRHNVTTQEREEWIARCVQDIDKGHHVELSLQLLTAYVKELGKSNYVYHRNRSLKSFNEKLQIGGRIVNSIKRCIAINKNTTTELFFLPPLHVKPLINLDDFGDILHEASSENVLDDDSKNKEEDMLQHPPVQVIPSQHDDVSDVQINVDGSFVMNGSGVGGIEVMDQGNEADVEYEYDENKTPVLITDDFEKNPPESENTEREGAYLPSADDEDDSSQGLTEQVNTEMNEAMSSTMELAGFQPTSSTNPSSSQNQSTNLQNATIDEEDTEEEDLDDGDDDDEKGSHIEMVSFNPNENVPKPWSESSSFLQVLNSHLDFLSDIISVSPVQVDVAESLWMSLVVQSENPEEMEMALTWFQTATADRGTKFEKDAMMHLLQNRLSNLSPEKYSTVAARLHQQLLLNVNDAARKIVRHIVYNSRNQFDVVRFPLIGLDDMWRLALQTSNEESSQETLKFIHTVYNSFASSLKMNKNPWPLYLMRIQDLMIELTTHIQSMQELDLKQVELFSESAPNELITLLLDGEIDKTMISPSMVLTRSDALKYLKRLCQLFRYSINEVDKGCHALRTMPPVQYAAEGSRTTIMVSPNYALTFSNVIITTHSNLPFGFVRQAISAALNRRPDQVRLFRTSPRRCLHTVDDKKPLSELGMGGTFLIEARSSGNMSYSSNITFKNSLLAVRRNDTSMNQPRNYGPVPRLEAQLLSVMTNQSQVMQVLLGLIDHSFFENTGVLDATEQSFVDDIAFEASQLLEALPADPSIVDDIYRAYHIPGETSLVIENVAQTEKQYQERRQASDKHLLRDVLGLNEITKEILTSYNFLYRCKVLHALLQPQHMHVAIVRGPRGDLISSFVKSGSTSEVIELLLELSEFTELLASCDNFRGACMELVSIVASLLLQKSPNAQAAAAEATEQKFSSFNTIHSNILCQEYAQADARIIFEDASPLLTQVAHRAFQMLIHLSSLEDSKSSERHFQLQSSGGNKINLFVPKHVVSTSSQFAHGLLELISALLTVSTNAVVKAFCATESNTILSLLVAHPNDAVRLRFRSFCQTLSCIDPNKTYLPSQELCEQRHQMFPCMVHLISSLLSYPLPFWQQPSSGRQRSLSLRLVQRSQQYFDLLSNLIYTFWTYKTRVSICYPTDDERSIIEEMKTILISLEDVVNPKQLLDASIDWLMNVVAQEQNTIQEQLLVGHLQLIRVLVNMREVVPDKVQFVKSTTGSNLIEYVLNTVLSPATPRYHCLKSSSPCSEQYPLDEDNMTCPPPLARTQNARQLAFSLLVVLVNTAGCDENIDQLLELLNQHRTDYKELLSFSPPSTKHWNINFTPKDKSVSGYVGLKNGGATCYMNAVIQQLYHHPFVADVALSIPNQIEEDHIKREEAIVLRDDPTKEFTQEETEKMHSIFYQLQRIFAHLKHDDVHVYKPEKFWSAFRLWGDNVDIRQHQDGVEFFSCLNDQLDEYLKSNNQSTLFSNTFCGTMLDQQISKLGRKVRQETFTCLGVRGQGNILQGFEQHIHGENMTQNHTNENGEEETIEIRKRTCINRLPPTMLVQLNRFSYDFEQFRPVKTNERVSFPLSLDMAPYTAAGLADQEGEEYDENTTVNPYTKYRLAGVIVHRGLATAGHYYTFVRQRKDPISTEPQSMLQRQISVDESSLAESREASKNIMLDMSQNVSFFIDEEADVIVPHDDDDDDDDDFYDPSETSNSTDQEPPANGRVTNWFRLDDDEVTSVSLTPNEFEHEFFGGHFRGNNNDGYYGERERNWNAYILVYEREDISRLVTAGASPQHIYQHQLDLMTQDELDRENRKKIRESTQDEAEASLSVSRTSSLQQTPGQDLLFACMNKEDHSQAIQLPETFKHEIALVNTRHAHLKHVFDIEYFNFFKLLLKPYSQKMTSFLPISLDLMFNLVLHLDQDRQKQICFDRSILWFVQHREDMCVETSKLLLENSGEFLLNYLVECPEDNVRQSVGSLCLEVFSHVGTAISFAESLQYLIKPNMPLEHCELFFKIVYEVVTRNSQLTELCLLNGLVELIFTVLKLDRAAEDRNIPRNQLDQLSYVYKILHYLLFLFYDLSPLGPDIPSNPPAVIVNDSTSNSESNDVLPSYASVVQSDTINIQEDNDDDAVPSRPEIASEYSENDSVVGDDLVDNQISTDSQDIQTTVLNDESTGHQEGQDANTQPDTILSKIIRNESDRKPPLSLVLYEALFESMTLTCHFIQNALEFDEVAPMILRACENRLEYSKSVCEFLVQVLPDVGPVAQKAYNLINEIFMINDSVTQYRISWAFEHQWLLLQAQAAHQEQHTRMVYILCKLHKRLCEWVDNAYRPEHASQWDTLFEYIKSAYLKLPTNYYYGGSFNNDVSNIGNIGDELVRSNSLSDFALPVAHV